MNTGGAPVAADDRIPLALRLYHAALAASFFGAWALEPVWRDVHVWLGYGVAGLLLWRLAYGLGGPRGWRFASFVVGPRHVWRYGLDLSRGRAELRTGYNPLAGWAIVGQMLVLGALALSGHGLNTDRFWGDETLQAVHALLVDLMWALIGLHLAGVVLASVRSRQLLPLAMLGGRRHPH